jgi:hypothetical protein
MYISGRRLEIFPRWFGLTDNYSECDDFVCASDLGKEIPNFTPINVINVTRTRKIAFERIKVLDLQRN